MIVSHFTFHGSSSERIHTSICMVIHGALSLIRLLPFLQPLPPVCPRLPLPPQTVPYLHYTIVMANLRCSAAEESEDTLNSFTSLTGYEPELLTFGELNDSSVPFSFMIPSTDQDVDDVTLGEMLTAAHRGQVDYCVPGGMSVSQSVVVCNVRWIRAT